MKHPPKVGSTHTKEFTVDDSRTIDFEQQDLPPVLATPWLIWLLEETALEAMLPVLDEGEMTVGVHVDVEHLAPTPVGQRLSCTTRVVHADGPLVSFQVEARDERELVAKGLHKRRVVTVERFLERVRQKFAGT